MAIGASRSQVVTQALVESILLAIGGGLAGLAVATGAARLLLSLAFSASSRRGTRLASGLRPAK